MLSYHGVIKVGAVHWIEGKPDDTEGASRRMREDVGRYLASSGIALHVHVVSKRAQLIECLRTIHSDAEAGARPLLHFDMHGSETDGLKPNPHEALPWPDVIDQLREINVATNNNLCALFASCFAFHAVSSVTLDKPCPARILIAPEERVSVGFLEDWIGPFYRKLVDRRDLSVAFAETVASGMQIFDAEQMFCRAFAGYVRNYTMGRNKADRVERLVTKITLQKGVPMSRGELRRARSFVRRGIQPTRALFEQCADVFLFGKQPSSSFEEVMAFARPSR